MTTLRKLVARDPWIKVVAFGLACAVWYMTNVLERDAERMVELPLTMQEVPRGLVVTDWPHDRILVTLRGPRPLLDGVDVSRARMVVSLKDVNPGETHVDLKTGRLEPDPPSSLSVVRVQPGRIDVTAVRLKKRRVAVRPTTIGDVAHGYRVLRVSADPERVLLSGPAAEIEKLEEVHTVPVQLADVTASIARRALLEWAGDFVTFVPDRVTVQVDVEEILVTREVVDVGVRVVERPATVEPPTVRLTLRGPALLMSTFNLAPGAVTVDASALEPGEHQVEAQIDVPEPIEVVTRHPEIHRVLVEEEPSP